MWVSANVGGDSGLTLGGVLGDGSHDFLRKGDHYFLSIITS